MIVKIENGKLGQAIDLLFNLSLKGKQSRHRTKFIKRLTERAKEVDEQRNELAKEHGNLDENGEVKTKNGQFDLKDETAFKKDVEELFKEEMVIEGGDAQGMLKTVGKVLEECNEAFSGAKAAAYDYLCDQFEGADSNDDHTDQ